MATIHRLEPATETRSAARPATAATSAEIILFPGVRYERWNETHDFDRQKSRSRKQRDRLEIAD